MTESAISVRGLGKEYQIGSYRTGYRTLRETVTEVLQAPLRALRSAPSQQPTESFWALRDVDFDVPAGEVVGLIGRNGAGKSTLLKILSRITEPSSGFIELRGRVASLLEVGTGFHPELTGRENIFLNGAILGMRRSEIQRQFDEIVAFSEVERFLDTPVKRYSSGMYVRLAFAVAAHLDPEILLVDEVLAVGDLSFQAKCLSKMQGISQSGRTVILVSHNLASIKRLCGRALLLADGRLVAEGPTNQVVNEYLVSTAVESGAQELTEVRFDEDASLPMQIAAVRIVDTNGHLAHAAHPITGAFRVEIEYIVRSPVQSAYVMCALTSVTGDDIVWTYDGDSAEFGNRQSGTFQARFDIAAHLLTTGRYFVRCAVVDTNKGTVHYPGVAFPFSVQDTDSLLAHRGIAWPGLIRLNPTWRTERLPTPENLHEIEAKAVTSIVEARLT